MKFSDNLLKDVSTILESKPRLSFHENGCDVLSKDGSKVKSFMRKDLGEKYKREAENFLAQNYKKLNAESVILEKKKDKGDMDGDGVNEPDDKEYMDNKDKAIKKAMKVQKEAKEEDDKDDDDGKKEPCPKCNGKGCEHCDGKGYHMKEENIEEGIPFMSKNGGLLDKARAKLGDKEADRRVSSRKARDAAVKAAVASTMARSTKKEEVEVEESNEFTDQLADRINDMGRGSHKQKVKKKKAEKAFNKGDYEKAADHADVNLTHPEETENDMPTIDPQVQYFANQLSELSKKTLGSYVKKASKDAAEKSSDAVHQYHSDTDDEKSFDTMDKAGKRLKGIKKAVDKLQKEAVEPASTEPDKVIGHKCATHVEHAEFGPGKCIPGMHTLEEDENGEGYVTHYDVMFENEEGPFIEENVSVEELTIVRESHHGHKKKK